MVTLWIIQHRTVLGVVQRWTTQKGKKNEYQARERIGCACAPSWDVGYARTDNREKIMACRLLKGKKNE